MAVAPPPPPPQHAVRDAEFYDKLGEEVIAMGKRLREIGGEFKNLGELVDS